MTTVNIAPEVALQEERAISAAHKSRILVLAQAFAELQAVLDQRDAEIKSLKAELAEATEGNEP